MKSDIASDVGTAEKEYSLWKVDTFEPHADIAVPFYPSPERPEISLDGNWQVKMDSEEQGFRENWFAHDDIVFEHTLPAPGNWNAQGLGGAGRISQKEILAGWVGQFMKSQGMRLTAQFKGSYHGLAWYRKQVPVPVEWGGRQIHWVFGGVLSSVRTWVNGQFVGGRWTEGNSFSFDVTAQIRPGQSNTLVMAIDNRWKETATLDHYHWYVPVGGPWHHMALRALPKVHIRSAIVRPELEGCKGLGVAHVCVTVANLEESEQDVRLAVDIASLQKPSRSFRTSGRLRAGGRQTRTVMLPVKIAPVEVWSCDEPNLYKVSVQLQSGRSRDTVNDRFGMRTVATVANRFELNQRPLFVLGQHFHFFWANETVPPITREENMAILRLFKAYGFNYLRVTWLMPEECYQAADEVGIMLQLDFPNAFEPYDKIKRPLVKRLIQECLEAYGNHPSLVLLCMSNEGSWDGQGALNPEFCAFSKFLDPTRLVLDTDGQPDDKLLEHGLADVFTTGGGQANDWRSYMQGAAQTREAYALRPTLDHEFLNVPTLPHVASFAQYGGAIVGLPDELAVDLPRRLREQGMDSEYDQYLRASYRHQFNFIKEGIERTRKNPLKAGFSMCAWNDMECGVHWGLLDAFMKPKAISPEAMRVFNAQSVVLMDSIDPATGDPEVEINYCHCSEDAFEIQPYVSCFSRQPMSGATLHWMLEDAKGVAVADGKVHGFGVALHAVTPLPRITIGPVRLSGPQQATLKLRIVSRTLTVENAWPIWLFPKVHREKVGRTVVASPDILDQIAAVVEDAVAADTESSPAGKPDGLWATRDATRARAWLETGKTVLFLADGGVEVGSQNPFDPGWFKSDQHMGSLVRSHPLLGDFPHDGFASWQFRYLINRAKDVPEGQIAGKPIISSAFNDTMPHVQHPLFVANTDTGGHLTYCMLKVLSGRCEASYLLLQLLKHAGRNKSDPVISMEAATKFLREKIA